MPRSQRTSRASQRRRPATPAGAIVSRPRVRRRYHFGSAGSVYIFVTLLIALGAFNAQNNLLFWAFGFSLAILIVSGILSGAMLMGLSISRERIADAHVGDPLIIRYRLRNSNRFIPAFALTIEEHAPAPRRRLRRNRAPAAPLARTFVSHVGPRESIAAEARLSTTRRGEITFHRFTVTTAFPFGLMRKSLEVDEPASTIILPALAPVDQRLLDAAAASGDSRRSSRTRGAGDEFHSLREYISGDNPRSIAWKPSARRGLLLVKQSLAPAPLRLWVVLRLRLDPTDANALDERAISIAAGLIARARARSLAIGLSVPLTGLNIPPRADLAHSTRLMRELGLIDLGPADARGRGAPFPLAAATHNASCLAIHAGPADSTYGPADRVAHLPVTADADAQQPVTPPQPRREPLSAPGTIGAGA